MNIITKSAPIGTLGLPSGDHWVKFHVEDDSISFEVAASLPRQAAASRASSVQTSAAHSFVDKWSGRGQLLSETEMANDDRLTALTAKHLR